MIPSACQAVAELRRGTPNALAPIGMAPARGSGAARASQDAARASAANRPNDLMEATQLACIVRGAALGMRPPQRVVRLPECPVNQGSMSESGRDAYLVLIAFSLRTRIASA